MEMRTVAQSGKPSAIPKPVMARPRIKMGAELATMQSIEPTRPQEMSEKFRQLISSAMANEIIPMSNMPSMTTSIRILATAASRPKPIARQACGKK